MINTITENLAQSNFLYACSHLKITFAQETKLRKTFNFEAIAWYLQLHIQLRFQPSIRSMMIKAISCLHGDGYHIESRTVLSHG